MTIHDTNGPEEKKAVPNDKLREERMRRNWTFKDVAEKIDLPDHRTVGRWERGISFPSAIYRRELCRIFEKSPEELDLLRLTDKENDAADEQSENFRKPPPFFTPFIGQQQDIDKVSTLLLLPETRLLTLLGTGGIGKTRMATEVATKVRTHFRNGVCFVALDTLRDPSLVLPAIVEALDIAGEAALPPMQQLKIFLKKKYILLFIDNFEYIVSAAPLLEELLQDCPNIKMLVTSQQRLNIQAEQKFQVLPLALPDLTALPDVDELTNYAAIALFIQRAQNLEPDFKLTTANAQAIAEICTRLDGLPLAIELAAARIKLLSPQSLLARLAQDFHILKSELRNRPDRQRTLDYAIGWSYGLLDTHEQWLLRHLSVFAGGATLETIEDFFHTESERPPDLMETVGSLLDKCLLRYLKQKSEEPRFSMLETIRVYSQDRLQAAGELEACWRAYALYYLNIVEQAAPHLKGPQQALQLIQLEKELSNLRAALGWLIKQSEAELALRFCEVFGKFCGLSGYWTEERYWLQAVLALPQASQQAAMRAKILRRAGHLAYRLRDLAHARQLFEQSAAYAREIEDRQTLAGTLSGLGWTLYRQNEIMAADHILQESIEVAHEAKDDWSLANVMESRGRFLLNQGKKEEARTLLEESVSIARRIQDTENLARILTTSAKLEIELGNLEHAKKLALESIALAVALDARPIIALTLDTLGDVEMSLGNYKQAKEHIKKRVEQARAIGDDSTLANRRLKLADIELALGEPGDATQSIAELLVSLREQNDVPAIIEALCILGDLKRFNKELQEAQARYQEALQLYRESGDERRVGCCLIGLAQISLEQGQVEHAAYLYGNFESRWKTSTNMHPVRYAEYQRAITLARTQLSEAAFGQAYSKGSTATLEQILASPTQ